jgi:hypothetical protein
MVQADEVASGRTQRSAGAWAAQGARKSLLGEGGAFAALRFGLLTQWYDPEPGPAALPGVLARGLRGRGHDVQVVTGFPNYPSGELAAGYKLKTKQDEWAEDVQVRRVALYPGHDIHAVRRIAGSPTMHHSASQRPSSALVRCGDWTPFGCIAHRSPWPGPCGQRDTRWEFRQ